MDGRNFELIEVRKNFSVEILFQSLMWFNLQLKQKQNELLHGPNFIIPKNLIDCINPQQEFSNPEASLELREEEKTPNYAALS